MRVLHIFLGVAVAIGSSIRARGPGIQMKSKRLSNGRELLNVFGVNMKKVGQREVLLDLEYDVTWMSTRKESGSTFQCEAVSSENKSSSCVGQKEEEIQAGRYSWKDKVLVARISDVVHGSVAATPNSSLNNLIITRRGQLFIDPSDREVDRYCPRRVSARLLTPNSWSFEGKVAAHPSRVGFEADVIVQIVSRPGILELPKGVWGDFFGQWVKAGVHSFDDVKGGFYHVPDCEKNNLPAIFISGEDGPLFRISPSKYTQMNEDGSCLLYVREGKTNKMKVGVDFISGYGLHLFGPGKQIVSCK